MKAIWQGAVIAESDETIIVESNHYFPRDAVSDDFLLESSTTSRCPWKGVAHYFSVQVGTEINPDAAWYYPAPKAAAKEIKGRVAFWGGVKIVP